MLRFELVKEPSETWAVFDTVLGVPADDSGKVLIGLTHEQAGLALFRLNVRILRSIKDRRLNG